MAKYVFLRDFPPTSWKKGDVFMPPTIKFDIALMLHTGVIEEVKEMEEEWPKEDDKYWCVDTRLITAYALRWDGDDDDKTLKEHGNIFRTQAEAEAALERVKKTLRGE